MKKLILVISLLLCLPALSQSRKPSRVVRDSIVEILYTDGTRRRMIWINDSTVMLVITDIKGRVSSRAYIEPEYAEEQKKIYFRVYRDQ